MTLAQIEARRQNILSLINSAGSTFLSVEFVKKDGEQRTIQVQLPAAISRVKGEEASEKAQKAVATRKVNNPNLLNVWDVTKSAFRSINLDTVFAVSVRGTRFDVGPAITA